jgi:N6-adenosine-specific RNA methylase IME4
VTALVRYDAARRALAEAKRVDEVKDIRDKAVAMQTYARQAKDTEVVNLATDIRLRAERRAGELLAEMEKNKGAVPGKTGRKGRPVLDDTPKLEDMGVTKTQSSRWQMLAAISEHQFENVIVDACNKTNRAVLNAVREVEIKQAREAYRKRTYNGGKAQDLAALAASGAKFSIIYPDPPWEFEVYSGKGKQRSAERYYDTMMLGEIKAMSSLIAKLAATDCTLLLWTSWPHLVEALEVIKAWGFTYTGLGFEWIKTTPSAKSITLDGKGLHWGLGYGARANSEFVLRASKGAPQRLDEGIHSIVIAPAGAHSEKPEEVAGRIERLYPGPYLELFARKIRPGWTVWGNEVP